MSVSCSLYRYHVENLRGLDKAILEIEFITKQSIRSGNTRNNLESFKRIYALLIAAWAEARLNKILTDKHTFTNNSLQAIERAGSQLNKWLKAVELAFKQHHNLTSEEITSNSIGAVHFERYSKLKSLLKNELKPIIEVRNKLAHGQWLYPLNRHSTNLSNNIYQALNNENHLSLKFKFQIIGYLSDIIHDLIISQPTFERDFSKLFRKIESAKTNLLNRKYEDYVQQLVANATHGKRNLTM